MTESGMPGGSMPMTWFSRSNVVRVGRRFSQRVHLRVIEFSRVQALRPRIGTHVLAACSSDDLAPEIVFDVRGQSADLVDLMTENLAL